MRVVYALMLCIMGAFGAKLCYIGAEHRLLFDNRECEILYQSLDIDDSNPPPFQFLRFILRDDFNISIGIIKCFFARICLITQYYQIS